MLLMIDNYDSFTYNLVQYVGQCGEDTIVKRNDEIDLAGIAALGPDAIMLSPGPCRPTDSGVCLDVSRAALDSLSPIYGLPLFGVCLGHQALSMVAGGTVSRAGEVRHGKTSPVEHDGKGLFAGIPNPMIAARYHSLTLRRDTLPPGFTETARALDDGEVMGIRHVSLPIEGVQFHPESVVTEGGLAMVQNFVNMARAR